MSTDNCGRRTCDGCYRCIEKVQRIHKGDDYCSACYRRLFIRGACPSCAGSVVYHKSELQVPKCSTCDRAERRCHRCNKLAPEARFVTVVAPGPCDGAPITSTLITCRACYHYYTPDAPCDICQRPSQRLSGGSHLPEDVRACPSCFTAGTHATCVRCRKFRKVVGIAEDGHTLCRACSGANPVVHACPACRKPVNGAGKSRCDECSIRSRLRREVGLHAAVLEREWIAALYRDFGEWLVAKNVLTGALPRRAVAAAGFFRSIDLDAHVCQPLIADDLLRIFDSKQLRANLNAMRFVCEHYGFKVDAKEREEARDLALIARRLQDAADQPWGKYLLNYRKWLADKPARTVSLYLGVAHAFCEDAQVEGPFGQAELVKYLSRVPGARATLGVWVTFVRFQYGWKVTMPPKRRKKPTLKRDAVKLADLLKRVSAPEIASDDDLSAILCLVYQYEPKELRRQITGIDASGNIRTKDEVIGANEEMVGIVREWGRRNL